MPTTRANGISIFYEVHGEVHGEGDPLLLIGGLGTDITLLPWLIARFSRRHRVIAFDNRGAGRTDKPDVPYTVEMLAADAAGLLDALGIGRADVAGFSMGGKVALELALSHPRLVGRLILISTSAAPRTDRLGRLTMSLPMRLASVLTRFGLMRGEYPQPHYAFQRQREASGRYDAVDRLGQVGAPTLIAHGRRDRSTPLARAEQLHAGISGSELEVYSGGHMFFVFSEREPLADRIERFLDSAPASE